MSYRRALLVSALIWDAGVLGAQSGNPEAVSRVSTAPPPRVVVSPDQSKLLLMEPGLPGAGSPASVVRIGGLRIDPVTGLAILDETYSALIVQPVGKPDPRRMILPWKARVAHAVWSPDGHRVAFTIQEDRGMSLWVGDPYTGVIQMLAGPKLQGSTGTPCQWFPSGDRLLCTRIPDGQRATPPSSGWDAQVEHFLASQLTVIPLSGPERPVGAPGIHGKVAIAPRGEHFLVETIHGPFPEQATLDQFARRTEVWNGVTGEVIRVLGDRGLIDRSPLEDAVPPGAREFEWRGDRPATVVWVEAQDAGDPSRAAQVRDRLYQLEAPFTGPPAPIADLEFRSRGIAWGSEGVAVVSEAWAALRKSQSWVVIPGGTRKRLGEPGATLGRFFTRLLEGGGQVLLTAHAGRSAYVGRVSGLDRIDLVTGRTRRIWQGSPSDREEVVGVIDAEEGRFLTRKQSNYYLRDLRKNGVVQLTRF